MTFIEINFFFGFTGASFWEEPAFERVHENDGTCKLDPLACLVHQRPLVSAYINNYSHSLLEGENIILTSVWHFYFRILSVIL